MNKITKMSLEIITADTYKPGKQSLINDMHQHEGYSGSATFAVKCKIDILCCILISFLVGKLVEIHE